MIFNERTMKEPYFTKQILTYMGNKRKFIGPLNNILLELEKTLNKQKGEILIGEGFSGSGILSRLFKTHASHLFTNDIAGYSKTLNSCYLSNISNYDKEKINKIIDAANNFVDNNKKENYEKFISVYWSDFGEKNTKSSRSYFTEENAIRIDKYMHFIKNKTHKSIQHFLLGPLLVECSMHNNTNGQFSAFYKDVDGLGKLGGKKEIDLKRITKTIRIPYPILKRTKCRNIISQKDTNEWVKELPELDVMYYDPPYNKHPYSIYYFLIDIINNWDTAIEVPETNRGQPKNWVKSAYNSFTNAEKTFEDLIKNTRAKCIILSYNNGGIIPIETIDKILKKYGRVEKLPIDYKIYNKLKGIAAYKRKGENVKVKEYLWILYKD
jgi:adenine-specific DNA-methyltransferase